MRGASPDARRSQTSDGPGRPARGRARRPRLRRSDCTLPGITRRRAGRSFRYLGPDGEPVRDPEVLDRIRALAIPPAWTDVWICTDPMGHIQAMGTDARGRRQYRYHPAWRERRDREKFDKMIEFGRALPALRARVAEDLAAEGLTRSRVLACAVRLLDLGFFRIGSEGYAEENQTYGLATMRKKHVAIDGAVITFDYRAKSGKRRIQSIADPAVLDVVRELKERSGGGHELLAYRDDDGAWRDVRSADINAYVRDATGGTFSAKDFRTWSATVLAAVALAVSATSHSTTSRRRAVVRACREVAEYLGNTPAVARASYIDPRVLDRFQTGSTIAPSLERLAHEDDAGLAMQGPIEVAVLGLLEDAGECGDLADLLDSTHRSEPPPHSARRPRTAADGARSVRNTRRPAA